MTPSRLLVDEHIRADSRVVRTWLRPVPGDKVAIEIVVDGEAPETLATLSAAAVAHVLRHYGRPLADEVAAELEMAERIAIGGGLAIARLRWRAAVDADGRDWLVLLAPDAEPLAALAPGVAGALRFIAAGRARP
jgi:hypothetical protein